MHDIMTRLWAAGGRLTRVTLDATAQAAFLTQQKNELSARLGVMHADVAALHSRLEHTADESAAAQEQCGLIAGRLADSQEALATAEAEAAQLRAEVTDALQASV